MKTTSEIRQAEAQIRWQCAVISSSCIDRERCMESDYYKIIITISGAHKELIKINDGEHTHTLMMVNIQFMSSVYTHQQSLLQLICLS